MAQLHGSPGCRRACCVLGRKEGEGSDRGVCSGPSRSRFALGPFLRPREVAPYPHLRFGSERLGLAKKAPPSERCGNCPFGSSCIKARGAIWVQIREPETIPGLATLQFVSFKISLKVSSPLSTWTGRSHITSDCIPGGRGNGLKWAFFSLSTN